MVQGNGAAAVVSKSRGVLESVAWEWDVRGLTLLSEVGLAVQGRVVKALAFDTDSLYERNIGVSIQGMLLLKPLNYASRALLEIRAYRVYNNGIPDLQLFCRIWNDTCT